MSGRRVIALVAALVATLLAAPAAAAWPPASGVSRAAGVNRYGTAVELSRQLYPSGSPARVYVATGENFPDALAGGAAAGNPASPAPVLLVTRDTIPEVTADELRRLAPGEIIVLGGTAAVSDSVLNDLRGFATAGARRVAGVNRYETAAALASEWAPGTPYAYLAAASTFHDALVASSVAGQVGAPVLLTSADGLPSSTRARLRELRPAEIRVVGPTSQVPDAQLDELRGLATSGSVVRIGDSLDVVDMSVLVADYHYGSAVGAVLATHADFPDALAASALAAARGAPLLFSDTDCLSNLTDEAITRLGVSEVLLAGGTAALDGDVERGQVCTPAPTGGGTSGGDLSGHVLYLAGGTVGNTYSSAGRRVAVEPRGTGEYTVRFEGLGTAGGVAHLTSATTPAGAISSSCSIDSWRQEGADELVDVRCQHAGAPAEGSYALQFTRWAGSSSRGHAYFVPDGTTIESRAPNLYNGTGSGVEARRLNPGQYFVAFPGITARPDGGAVKATAVGDPSIACISGPPPDPPDGYGLAVVHCYSLDTGHFVDTPFTVSFVHQTSIGAAGGHAYGRVDQNPDGSWSVQDPMWHSSSGSAISVARVSAGKFTVTIPGVQSGAPSAQLSWLPTAIGTCGVEPGISSDATALVMTVRCAETSGTPVDFPFYFQVVAP